MIDICRFLLLLALFNVNTVFAQREALIGDTVPDVELTMLNYKKPNISLSELRGKAVIIDFWGTWCAPCVASFVKLDSLQNEFKSDLFILSVTDEDRQTVDSFLTRFARVKKIKPATAVEDKFLYAVFPHRTVPHYVWIDQQGIVQAITFPEEITSSNIRSFISTGKANFAIKNEPASIAKNPLQKVAEDSNITHFRAVSKYIPGLFSGYGFTKNMITVSNQSLLGLYAMAYGEGSLEFLMGWNRRKLITNDSLKFTPGLGKTQQFKSMWITNHSFTYVLKVPLEDSSKKYQIMRKDLEEYFPWVSASIRKEERECYVLQRINNSMAFQATDTAPFSQEKSPYHLKVKNGSMKVFVALLKWAYQTNSLPIVDETHHTGKVDINLETEISNPEKLNTALAKYGLILKKEKRPIDILVIRNNI